MNEDANLTYTHDSDLLPPDRVQVGRVTTDDDCYFFAVRVAGEQVAVFASEELAELFAAGFRLGLNYDLPY